MLHLQAPAALALYLAALLLTGAGVFHKKGSALLYAGGLCWVGAALAALYAAVSLRVILAATLLLLGVSALRPGRGGAP